MKGVGWFGPSGGLFWMPNSHHLLQGICYEKAIIAAGGALNAALGDVIFTVSEGAAKAATAVRLFVVVDELATEQTERGFALAEIGREESAAALGSGVTGKLPGTNRAPGKLTFAYVRKFAAGNGFAGQTGDIKRKFPTMFFCQMERDVPVLGRIACILARPDVERRRAIADEPLP